MSIEIVYLGKPRALTLDPSMSLVEAHLKEVLARPEHYYAVSSPDDPVARRGTQMRQEDHELWQSVLPQDDEDIDIVLARLRRSLGRGDQFLMSAISAHHRLNELPQLKAVQEQHFHLDLPRLKVIDSVLCKADTTVLEHGPDPLMVDTLKPAFRWGSEVPFHHATQDLHRAVQA